MDPTVLFGFFVGTLVALLVSHGLTAWGAWRARGRVAEAEQGRVEDELDDAHDAIVVLKVDAAKQNFSSGALVQAERSIVRAHAAATRRGRARGLLLPDGPPGGAAPGPGPASG